MTLSKALDMQIRTVLLLATALGILGGCASDSLRPTREISLDLLPTIQAGNYRVGPYIEAAIELQAAGKKAAFQQLLVLARSSGGSDFGGRQRIAVLCRMLFTQRPGSDFDRPGLGAPQFLGNDSQFPSYTLKDPNFKKWPLEPIELVDEVPFAVVTGYMYEGFWDPLGSESYVRYCINTCEWSNVLFTTKNKEEKEFALRKLLSSPKWQRPLEAWEKEFLMKQVE